MLLKIVVNTLFSRRIRAVTLVSIICFLVGAVLTFAPSWFNISNTRNLYYVLTVGSNIMLGIATSTLAAALVTTLEQVKTANTEKLMKLFSVEIGKKVAIVIPHFDSSYFQDSKEGVQSVRNLEGGITGISYTDFSASKFLVGLFQRANLPIPDLITDWEAKSILEDSAKFRKYSAFISVGLYSNQFSDFINKSNNASRLFHFERRDYDQPGDRTIKYNARKNTGEPWDYYTPNNLQCSDIAMLSKIKMKGAGDRYVNVLLCGGLNATGTSKICEMLYNKWDTEVCKIFVRDEMGQTKKILDCDHFTLLYKVEGKRNSRFDTGAENITDDPIVKVGK